MRSLANALTAVLLIIALVGIGFSVWAVAAALSQRDHAQGLLAALAVGVFPFLVGTVALAGAVIAILCEEILSELKLANLHAPEGTQSEPRQSDPDPNEPHPTSWAAGPKL